MLRKYLIAGLLIWLPLAITLWVLDFIVTTMDRTLVWLPPSWHPDQVLGFHIPGLGLVVSVLILLLTGVLAANIIGARFFRWWETLLARIPIVRSIYSSVKQVSDTLFASIRPVTGAVVPLSRSRVPSICACRAGLSREVSAGTTSSAPDSAAS